MRLFLRSLFFLTIALLAAWQQLYAQKQVDPHIDSLIKTLAKSRNDTNKALLLDDLSFSYYTINPDEGLKYGQQELDIAQSLQWKKGIALAYNSIGDNYLTKSDFPVALEYYFKAVKINTELGYKLSLAKNYNHIGVVYKQQKDYQVALDYYQKALKINETLGYHNGVALNLGNIGNIYCFQKNYQKALECHSKSLKIYEASGNYYGIGNILGNIGLVYKNQGDYQHALEYYFKGLKIDEKLNQKNEIQIKLGNIGDCYLRIAKNTGQKDSLVKAVYFLKKGIVVCKELGNLVDLITFAKNLSEAETIAGNDKEALESYRQYVLFKDSVFSMQNDEKITMIDYNRKRDADSLKIALTQNEQAYRIRLLEKENKLNNLYLWVTVVVLLMALVIIAQIYINYKRTRKNISSLTILNAQVSDQKVELEKKNKEKDRILHMVAHDLRTPVGGVFFLANEMQSGNLSDFDSNEVFSMIKEASETAMTLINELLGYSDDLNAQLVKEPVDIVKLVSDTLKLLQFKVNEKQQKLVTKLPPAPVIININKDKIIRVIGNLAVNAMKFSREGAQIIVTVEHQVGKVIIAVKDQGIGIPLKMQGKVFDMFTKEKRFGTAGEKSYGLGLSICKQVIDAHGGKIWFDSEEGKGATFFVLLPE